MRTISDPFRKFLYDHDGTDVIVALVTIYHASLPGGVTRISSDNHDLLDYDTQKRGTISNGHSYEFLPFEFVMPEEADEAQPTIQMTISNVSNELTPLLRSTSTPVNMQVHVVTASRPGVIEIAFDDFQMISADVEAGQVVLSLNVDLLVAEPFPAGNFTPSTFGGLWATT